MNIDFCYVAYTREEIFIKEFGKHIARIRKSKKLTQEDLAFKSELEYSQISRIERGVINTSISQVYKIAKALEIPVSELFVFNKKNQ